MNNYFIYLAGGMTGLSHEEQMNWRLDVKDKLESYICDYKIKCFNPVEYYSLEDTTPDVEVEAMNFDLYKLKGSNLVIVNFNNMHSLGTQSEIAIAWDNHIPIIGLNEFGQQLHSWQYAMCSKIFMNKDDMLEYIKNYYLD